MSAIHRPSRTFTDYAAMLADPALDAVVIATADQFHVPAARQAIRAGKHALVEKPLGAVTSECLPLRDEVRASGLVLQVGTMRRFDPGISFARDFVRDEIGELIALKAWYCDSAYRYQMTDTLQPVAAGQRQRSQAARRPEERPPPLLHARARQPPHRHRAVPGRRGDRDGASRSRRARRARTAGSSASSSRAARSAIST